MIALQISRIQHSVAVNRLSAVELSDIIGAVRSEIALI